VIMSTTNETITMGLDRWNAMLAWWGVPAPNGNGRIEDQIKRLQAFTADLQRAYGDSYARQVTALLKANERIVGSLQQLLHCQQPQELVAAETDLMATMLEGASRQAAAWAEMMQKVQDCTLQWHAKPRTIFVSRPAKTRASDLQPRGRRQPRTLETSRHRPEGEG
jgi:hypothetical protein